MSGAALADDLDCVMHESLSLREAFMLHAAMPCNVQPALHECILSPRIC
jgi:hypothetical protein